MKDLSDTEFLLIPWCLRTVVMEHQQSYYTRGRWQLNMGSFQCRVIYGECTWQLLLLLLWLHLRETTTVTIHFCGHFDIIFSIFLAICEMDVIENVCSKKKCVHTLLKRCLYRFSMHTTTPVLYREKQARTVSLSSLHHSLSKCRLEDRMITTTSSYCLNKQPILLGLCDRSPY